MCERGCRQDFALEFVKFTLTPVMPVVIQYCKFWGDLRLYV